MAAHACCDGAAPQAAARRLKLRRPSRSSSIIKKARKLRKARGGGGGGVKSAGPAASRKRVMVIRRKMEALRRLVPVRGGEVDERVEDGRLEELLLHAAGYILRLQMQVRVMQVMVHALNSTED